MIFEALSIPAADVRRLLSAANPDAALLYIYLKSENSLESAAEELQVMIAAQQWQRADETIQAYMSSWTKTVPWLQTLINHDDADDVTLALKRLQAGIKAQDVPLCLESCAELRESAEHLYHRDAFTPGNVL